MPEATLYERLGGAFFIAAVDSQPCAQTPPPIFPIAKVAALAPETGRATPAHSEVAAELGRTLDVFKVPSREKKEVLAAFAAHKGEVTAGYLAPTSRAA